jgi:hypothetical protein
MAAGGCTSIAAGLSAEAFGWCAGSGDPQAPQNTASGGHVPPHRGHLTSLIASHLSNNEKKTGCQRFAHSTASRQSVANAVVGDCRSQLLYPVLPANEKRICAILCSALSRHWDCGHLAEYPWTTACWTVAHLQGIKRQLLKNR